MAQAFTLVDANIPSAGVLLKSKRKNTLGPKNDFKKKNMYKEKTCPTLSSTMPVKAKFHRTLLEHVLGTQYWALRLPRTNHQEYTNFGAPGGGSKKERAQQFVTEAASLMLQILQFHCQTTSCKADLSVRLLTFPQLQLQQETSVNS